MDTSEPNVVSLLTHRVHPVPDVPDWATEFRARKFKRAGGGLAPLWATALQLLRGAIFAGCRAPATEKRDFTALDFAICALVSAFVGFALAVTI